MSLDVSLGRKKIVSYDEGKTFQDEYDYLYEANITHNMNIMAGEAGLYDPIWRPHRLKPDYDRSFTHIQEWEHEDKNPSIAGDIIKPIERGLADLKARPDYFKKFNPPNKWGDYDGFLRFVENYLEACKANPTSRIFISR
jgi:hypothetical protein